MSRDGREGHGEPGDDPYVYGWREIYETLADGTRRLRRQPLTYADLLDPQEGDFVAESTVHRQVISDLAARLERRYADEPSIAVWGDLKLLFTVPGLTTGPAPDVCVVEGVEDRERLRRSFRLGEEPGQVRLVIEVVSENSVEKDYRDLVEIYSRMEVEEYLAVRPTGDYADGPYDLRAWRLDRESGLLRPLRRDVRGRFHSRATGLLFGTGPGGWGLRLWDAETGERLPAPVEEEERQARRAAEAEARAAEEAAARRAAEERAVEEAVARRAAEVRAQELEAELERLRRSRS